MKKYGMIFILVVALILCSCGKGGDSSFKVEEIITADNGLYLSGKTGEESKSLALSEAFKDCKVADVAFVGGEAVLKGTKNGRLAIESEMIVTLKNDEGKNLEVRIKEGSIFETEKKGDRFYLLAPKE